MAGQVQTQPNGSEFVPPVLLDALEYLAYTSHLERVMTDPENAETNVPKEAAAALLITAMRYSDLEEACQNARTAVDAGRSESSLEYAIWLSDREKEVAQAKDAPTRQAITAHIEAMNTQLPHRRERVYAARRRVAALLLGQSSPVPSQIERS